MGDISKDIQSTFQSEKIRALVNIKYTANWIESHQNAFFKPYGISPQQYNILRILNGAGKPLKVQTIKERMIERAPNATRMMDKLCAKQFIERLSCLDDRRVVHISITKKGINLLKQINQGPKIDVLKNLTDNEASMLSALLDKIR